MRAALILVTLTLLLSYPRQVTGQRDNDRNGHDAAHDAAAARRDAKRIEQQRSETNASSRTEDRTDRWIERTQKYVCGPGCDYAGALVSILVAARNGGQKSAAAAGVALTAICDAACDRVLRAIKERREADRREGSASDRAFRERQRRDAWERLREKEERMHPPNRKATQPADVATQPVEMAEREMFYVTATSLALLPTFEIPDTVSVNAPDAMNSSCSVTNSFGDLECVVAFPIVPSVQCRAYAVYYLIGLWYSQFLGDSTYQIHVVADCGQSRVILDQGPRGLRVTQPAEAYRREFFWNPN
jgi:hypothetical protein